LPGETMPGTEDGPPRGLPLGVVPKISVTAGHHRLCGSGEVRPASAAAPGSAPAREGAASADAPGAESPPRFPADAIAWWCCPSQFTLSHLASSRPAALQPG